MDSKIAKIDYTPLKACFTVGETYRIRAQNREYAAQFLKAHLDLFNGEIGTLISMGNETLIFAFSRAGIGRDFRLKITLHQTTLFGGFESWLMVRPPDDDFSRLEAFNQKRTMALMRIKDASHLQQA